MNTVPKGNPRWLERLALSEWTEVVLYAAMVGGALWTFVSLTAGAIGFASVIGYFALVFQFSWARNVITALFIFIWFAGGIALFWWLGSLI